MEESGEWPGVLQHFVQSLVETTPDPLEVQVLRFNASSPARLHAVGAYSMPAAPLDSAVMQASREAVRRLAASMTKQRFVAWHSAMLFKVESWARVAGNPRLDGQLVLCADADHTFFPGWKAVVEDCLSRHDMCFEANLWPVGTSSELSVSYSRFRWLGTPNNSFWGRAWVNTGLFAMRCGPLARWFWLEALGCMRRAFSDHGSASDQNAVNFILMNMKGVWNWGILDPFAINQLSPFSLGSEKAAPPKTVAWRMLDKMVLHHAAYLGDACRVRQLGPAACKLWLMRVANETWHVRRRGPQTMLPQRLPQRRQLLLAANRSAVPPPLARPG